MSTKLSYTQKIERLFKDSTVSLTCAEICKILIKKYKIEQWKRQYLSGSISSKLHKLVQDGFLAYSTTKKGPRGGYVYKLNIPEQ